MSTLSGFTRPTDPINANDVGIAISTALGKTVTVVVTPTDLQVTGSTLVSGDQTATQVAITAYFYAYLQYGAPISDNPAMSSTQHGRGVTESVVAQGDLATYTAAIAYAQRKAWVTGVLKPNTFVYYSKATTVSGNVTFYITDDGTATGNAVFTNVYADSTTISPYGSSAVYQISAPTVASDKKSITATVNQVTSVVLGLIQISSAANGVQVNMLVLGD